MKFQPARRLSSIEKSDIRKIFDRAEAGSINLGLGEPDFPTPEVIRQRAVQFLQKGKVHYTPNAGYLPLRKAIAGYYGDAARYESVCVTSGSQEALYIALMVLVNPGDEVLLPDPGFVAYPTVVRMAGGKTVFYKLPAQRDFTFDPADFQSKLTEKTRVVITASPSNPTGRILKKKDLQFISDALRNTDVFVLADEIYRELYYGEYPLSMRDFYPRTLTTSGLSKSCAMTGWRIGWVFGDPDVVQHFTVLHQYISTSACAISQHGGMAAFSEQGRAAQGKIRDDFCARRDFILELIDSQLKCPRVVPEGAFYLMLDVSQFGNSFQVAERLLRSKVITIPGSSFGKEGEGYLRLSYATDFDILAEGIRRIKSALLSGK